MFLFWLVPMFCDCDVRNAVFLCSTAFAYFTHFGMPFGGIVGGFVGLFCIFMQLSKNAVRLKSVVVFARVIDRWLNNNHSFQGPPAGFSIADFATPKNEACWSPKKTHMILVKVILHYIF